MRHFTAIAVAASLALVAFQAESRDSRSGAVSRTSLDVPCPEEPIYANGAFAPRLLDECGDPGSGGGGGGGDPGSGTPVPPFSPPFMFPPLVSLPTPFFDPSAYQQCNQIPHPFFSLGNNTYSNDVAQGTTLYFSGVVARGTRVVYGFYNPAGQLAAIKETTAAGSNCVIAHEPNGFNTAALAPGYYNLYASFVGLGAPNTVQCFFGRIPDNVYVSWSGFPCPQPMYLVTTIRVR